MNWQECIEKARSMDGHYSLSETEQEALYEAAVSVSNPGSVIVEIGVCNGKTAAVLNYVASNTGATYYGVDNFSLENNATTVEGKLLGLGYYPNLLVGDSYAVPFPDIPIDLLLIDGGHEPVPVTRDCERWVPKVRSGGIIAWHDYDSVYDPASAHHAIRENVDRITQGWDGKLINGLFIAKKP